MACNDNNKFEWTPERRAALLEEAIKRYYANGADMTETIQGLSQDLGRSQKVIMDGLTPQGKLKSLSDKMWMEQYARRQIGLAAKRFASSMSRNGLEKVWSGYDSFMRKLATVGHFTVFGKTHMGDKLWTNPIQYLKNFKNSAFLPTEGGMSAHEQRMTAMRLDDSMGQPGQLYDLAVRSKLDATSHSEASQILGGGKGKKWSHAAFEELQLRRFEEFKKQIMSLPPDQRTAANGEPIARVINNNTGGGAPGRVGSLFGRFLFGPRLTPAQWRAAFEDNVKASWNGIFNRSNASPGDIVAAKMVGVRMAKLLMAYGGAMGLEAAYSKAAGDKRNMPNFTNPADTGTFMRLKIAGKGVPLSPTVELLTMPVRMIYSALYAKPGENHWVKFVEPLAKYAGYRLSPGLALLASVGVGQELFSGRPMPWHQPVLTQKGQPVMSELTHPKLTYTEFLGERLPIPAAVFLRDVYDEMRAEGVDHATSKSLILGAVAAATTGITGYEWHPPLDTPYTRADAATPENANEKLGRHILYEKLKEFRRDKAGQPEPKELFGFH